MSGMTTGYEAQAEYPSEARAPGAVATLADQVERLHHQITVLQDQLQPVLREPGPEKALDAVPMVQTPIEQSVQALAEAVERIVRLRDRLVI